MICAPCACSVPGLRGPHQQAARLAGHVLLRALRDGALSAGAICHIHCTVYGISLVVICAYCCCYVGVLAGGVQGNDAPSRPEQYCWWRQRHRPARHPHGRGQRDLHGTAPAHHLRPRRPERRGQRRGDRCDIQPRSLQSAQRWELSG